MIAARIIADSVHNGHRLTTAGVREADLSAVLNGRKPSGRAVGAILERLRKVAG